MVEVVSVVRATHPALHFSRMPHACALATHRCGVDGGARGRRVARAAEREGVCRVSRRDDDGAGDGGSEAVDV